LKSANRYSENYTQVASKYISKCTNVTHLDIRDERTDYSEFTKLRSLKYRPHAIVQPVDWKLNLTLPQTITELVIHSWIIDTETLNYLATLHGLLKLSVVTGAHFIKFNPNITHLNLQAERMNRDTMDEILQLKHLRKLELSYNHTTFTDPNAFQYLGSNSSITDFSWRTTYRYNTDYKSDGLISNLMENQTIRYLNLAKFDPIYMNLHTYDNKQLLLRLESFTGGLRNINDLDIIVSEAVNLKILNVTWDGRMPLSTLRKIVSLPNLTNLSLSGTLSEENLITILIRTKVNILELSESNITPRTVEHLKYKNHIHEFSCEFVTKEVGLELLKLKNLSALHLRIEDVKDSEVIPLLTENKNLKSLDISLKVQRVEQLYRATMHIPNFILCRELMNEIS
jgi:hypothetical protein